MSRAAPDLVAAPPDPARAGLRHHVAVVDARYLLAFAAVAAFYVGTAKVGIEVSVARGVITPVWAPTGIALAALLILGPRLWPAVAVGAFIANATSDVSLLVAAFVAVGNTLEAVVGAYLLRRTGFRNALDRVRDVLLFVVLAAIMSTTIAATTGVTTLLVADVGSASNYGSDWMLWWFGDAIGALLVAPLLLVWSTQPRTRPTRRVALEAGALFAGLVVTSLVVFITGHWRYPYLLFPFIIWAALRFKQVGAATATFVVSAIAIAATITGSVPIGGTTPTEDVQILQALLAVVAISLLVVGATLSEREVAKEAREQAYASLAEAQEIAHVGSWDWDIESDRVTWSDELFRIFGLEPQSVAVSFESFLERVHPDDREAVRQTVERAYVDHEPFAFEHRIVHDDGVIRTIHARGEVIVSEAGRAVRMVGTGQDITERHVVDRLRDEILATVSHELRTPLTSILGFSVTLKDRVGGMSDATVRDIVEHLEQQATKLDRLLSDLLDVDQLRRGLGNTERRPTDLGLLVEQVAASQVHVPRRLELDTQAVVAEVDVPKVERIVENLLANAFKYTRPGTRVLVRVAPVSEGALIAVDDEGPGIPDELKDEVFDVFKRGPNVTTLPPGTGIGLSLVAQFAELHGGRAWVEDNAHGGSSFRVVLPRHSRRN